MLRTRKKDVNIKPNRKLDKKSSRGMLFENEELRLRTIEINAEVERGHSDIKKLKKENEQLKREIWYLRNEYDRLEDMLKKIKGDDYNEDEEDAEEDEEDEEKQEDSEDAENIENLQKDQSVVESLDGHGCVDVFFTEGYPEVLAPRTGASPDPLPDPSSFAPVSYTLDHVLQGLDAPPPEIVVTGADASADSSSSENNEGFSTVLRRRVTDGNLAERPQGNSPHGQMQSVCSLGETAAPLFAAQRVTFSQDSSADESTRQSSTFHPNPVAYFDGEEVEPAILARDGDRRMMEFAPHASPSLVRLNSIEPNTLVFSTTTSSELAGVTVQEVIDELEKQFDSDLCEVKGVRVTGTSAYVCLSRHESLQTLLAKGLSLRGIQVQLVDVSHDSKIAALYGVPHYVSDATVSLLLCNYGTLIGEVERRFYKGVDTGERFVRIKLKPNVELPEFFCVGGCRVQVKLLSAEEVGRNLWSSCDPTKVQDSPKCQETSHRQCDQEKPPDNETRTPVDSPRSQRAFEYRSQLNVRLKVPDSETDKAGTSQIAPVHRPVTRKLGIQPMESPTLSQKMLKDAAINGHPPLQRQGTTQPPSGLKAPSSGQDSPTKQRASVNFEESPPKIKPSLSPRPSMVNGILRKTSTSGDPDGDILPDKAKSKLLLGRSFSLDPTKIRQQRKKLEAGGVLEESGDSSDGRKDWEKGSVSSKSSRSSKSSKSRDISARGGPSLPWCGCWGNGCL